MSLNLKNPKTNQLIHELAALRGTSLTNAVTEAVEEKLTREKELLNRRKLSAEWLMEISRETSALMNDGRTLAEIMDELYDPETGLPH
ncbi:MAG TPA: type II toxin-antitoxin system VapB family antitoxin [Terracidiphilus sp.]|nr:type II toxin-antitoxin system VapB family antitoxin [Terracidiphilus sp.]